MASFRTHISFGIALGVLSVFLLASLALAPSGWSYFVLVWLMVTVGAILPDMDSDSGVPFHVTFGSLSLVAGGVVFLAALENFSGDFVKIIGLTAFAIGLVWGVFGSIFKRFTRHRGMAHSIPAAFLAGLLVFSISSRSDIDEWRAFLLGVAMVIGFLLHLVLDEVYAAVNFHGTPFVPNQALGSAIKFFSHSRNINILVYGLIAFFLAGNIDRFFSLGVRLFSAFR